MFTMVVLLDLKTVPFDETLFLKVLLMSMEDKRRLFAVSFKKIIPPEQDIILEVLQSMYMGDLVLSLSLIRVSFIIKGQIVKNILYLVIYGYAAEFVPGHIQHSLALEG